MHFLFFHYNDVSIPIGFSNGCNGIYGAITGVGGALFQSLSGFLMVATPAVALLHKVDSVSIPIGFSNGCNGPRSPA